MVDNFCIIVLLCCVALPHLVNAQYGNCDYEGTIYAAGQSRSVNHSATSGTCRYKAIAPVDTFIQANCSITLQDNTCSRQSFVVSRSGEKDLRDGLSYCGSRTLKVQSIGNELVVVIRTNIQNSGSFFCQFTAIAPDNSNCDCGWNVDTKIVGGTPTGVNEFVSHAGLIDGPTGETFCGAVISNTFCRLCLGLRYLLCVFSQSGNFGR